jgi:hypothetical protein
MLELPNEQFKDIKIEKIPNFSSYFILVHHDKLFEKTQSGPPRSIDIRNHLAIEKIHSLWYKRRNDWCFKFKVQQSG